jgi:hypothetical protein
MQMPPPPVSIVYPRHCHCCCCHRATSAATATTMVKIIIVHGRRKRQQQHHHQRTNGSTNVKMSTSPDDLDLFYFPTATREFRNSQIVSFKKLSYLFCDLHIVLLDELLYIIFGRWHI